MTLLAYFIDKLAKTPDGDGTRQLDHSLDSLRQLDGEFQNEHNHFPRCHWCCWAARRARLQGGRHVKFPERTSMANLLLAILDKSGIRVEKLGDSTGVLQEFRKNPL